MSKSDLLLAYKRIWNNLDMTNPTDAKLESFVWHKIREYQKKWKINTIPLVYYTHSSHDASAHFYPLIKTSHLEYDCIKTIMHCCTPYFLYRDFFYFFVQSSVPQLYLITIFSKFFIQAMLPNIFNQYKVTYRALLASTLGNLTLPTDKKN